MRKFIKPVDVIIVAVILICSLLIIRLFTYDTAQNAIIYVNGEEFGRYSLHNDKEQIIEVSSEYGRNVVIIDKQKVWVSETDCEDEVEIKSGTISRPGQSLVCLPNRLVVTIEGRAVTDATAF